MDDSALRSSHQKLSAVDWRFREHARQDPQLLRRETFSALDHTDGLVKYSLQPWPVFVDENGLEELEHAALGINSLLRQVPRRVFQNDPVRLHRFFDLYEPTALTLALAPPNWLDEAVGRADFVRTADGFKCLEVNMGGNLGGWEIGTMSRLLLSVPPVREFLDREQLQVKITDTLALFLDYAVGLAAKAGLHDGFECNLAIVGASENNPGIVGYLNQQYTAALRKVDPRLRGSVVVVDDDSLSFRRQRLKSGGKTIHLLVQPEGELLSRQLVAAQKTGRLHIYNGAITLLLTDKRNLAILSDPELGEPAKFTEEERRLLDRHLPWTRLVRDGETVLDGATVQLRELLATERPNLVLKRGLSLQGRDICIGHTASDEEWTAMVAKAFEDGDWVVQWFEESVPFLFQEGDEGCSPHDAIWGPFFLGDRFAGASLRVQPKASGGIVNAARGATKVVVLELD